MPAQRPFHPNVSARRAASAGRPAGVRVSRGRRRRLGAFIGRMVPIAAAIMGAISFLALTDGGRGIRHAQPLMVQIDRFAEQLGFGLETASVSGYRMTSARAVLDAIDMADTRSLIRFDSGAARRRIEALPWVAEARVSTVWPHAVEVRVRERAPFAVWQQGDKDILVDINGRRLAEVGKGSVDHLLVISGDGAPKAAGEIVQLLGTHADLKAQIVSLERIGGRRWTLHLSGGRSVLLPAKGIGPALEQFTEGVPGTRLMDADFRTFDLRDPAHPRVRIEKPSAAKVRS